MFRRIAGRTVIVGTAIRSPACGGGASGSPLSATLMMASPTGAAGWSVQQRRAQSLSGPVKRRPGWDDGELVNRGDTVENNRHRFDPDTAGHHVKARIQEERRQIGLTEVFDWHEFAKGAVRIPTRSGALWVGQDDPRVVKYMRRKEKHDKKPHQIAREQPKVDAAKALERHPYRAYFSTPSDFNDPITIADGLAKAGMIKVHDVKHMATQIKWKTRTANVSILGHVDHGKTTLLDYLRNTNVASGEAGGITQSIGAFRVNVTNAVKRAHGESEIDVEALRVAHKARRHKAAQVNANVVGASPSTSPAGSGGVSSIVNAAATSADQARVVAAPAPDLLEEFVDPCDYLTFIDTPGHAAFKEMRESGAAATDVALLIVSAVDGVQPQTLESLEILREKRTPFIVVFTKIDREPNVTKAQEGLRKAGVEFEEDGGDVMSVAISAMTGEGVPELLETLQLQVSILELVQPTPARAEVLVIDSHNKFKNAVAGIVRSGTLRQGQTLASGTTYAVVSEMFDETGKTSIRTAEVGQPVLIHGFRVLPKPGVIMFQLKNDDFGDKYHHLMADVYRTEGTRESYLQTLNAERMGNIYDRKPENNEVAILDAKPFNLCIKASSFGQLQAVMRLVYELPPIPKVLLQIRGAEVGGLNDYDLVSLTGKQQPGGILIFGEVQASHRLELPEFIEEYKCDVVYHGIQWLKEKLVAQLPKQYNIRVVSEAKVKQTFRASQAGAGNAGGLEVVEGTLLASEPFRVMRPVKVGSPEMHKVYEGMCRELRRFKEQVPSVEHGLECGIIMNDDFTFRTGDVVQQVARDEILPDVDAIFREAAELEAERRRRLDAEGEVQVPSPTASVSYTPGSDPSARAA